MAVATMPNAVIGSYWNPSHSVATTATTSWSHTATWGDRYRGWTAARARGSNPWRPMANQVRVAAFDPALEFAIVEFTIAANTSTHALPHTACAMAGQLVTTW